MKPIDPTEHETILEGFNELVNSTMDRLIEETIAPLRGRTVTTIRKVTVPVTGEFKEHTVTVTIEGGHLDYDGGLVLVGTYPHPFSGKPVGTDVNPF
jgi:hypothetical protein